MDQDALSSGIVSRAMSDVDGVEQAFQLKYSSRRICILRRMRHFTPLMHMGNVIDALQ